MNEHKMKILHSRLHSTPPSTGGGGSRSWQSQHLGVKIDQAREKEMEGWGETVMRGCREEFLIQVLGTLPLGPQPAERLSLVVPCDGTGHLWWIAWWSFAFVDDNGFSGWGQLAASPPFPAHLQSLQTAPGSGLLAKTAQTSPISLRLQPPPPDTGAHQQPLCPTCWTITPSPPPWAATSGLCSFMLPDLLSTVIPLSGEGSLTMCPSFLLGFATNVTKSVEWEEWDGNRRTFKHKTWTTEQTQNESKSTSPQRTTAT